MSNRLFNKIELKYNFQAVERKKFYISAQPSKEFLSYLKDKYGIKTIINLRNGTKGFERNFAESQKIHLVHIPLIPLLKNPNQKKILSFLRVFRRENELPVLMHCRQGKDRSGVMRALFHLYCQKWPSEKIFQEMNQKNVNLYWKIFTKVNWKKFEEIKYYENLI